jgi:hypothetical protein
MELCSWDRTTARTTYMTVHSQKKLTITSAYLSCDVNESSPIKEMRDVINYCRSRRKQLITECDAIAHHTIWGSCGTNPVKEFNGIFGEFKHEYSQSR